MGNREISEDITSETFTIAIERIDEFKGNCKLSVWLCQIAKFLFYKETKKLSKIKFSELEEIQDECNLELNLIEKQEKLKLFKDIQELDEKTKDVVYLRIMGNLTFDEIAEITGKTANWARVIYFRGKEKLKEVNKDEHRKRM
ncbi:MAG: sigma-70 family RNA polymerase sigma factor [Clostridia bacterium]|nr:sigma-70 family RNA polymerase sigma factor [Clostridia bacterium]